MTKPAASSVTRRLAPLHQRRTAAQGTRHRDLNLLFLDSGNLLSNYLIYSCRTGLTEFQGSRVLGF